MKTAGVQKLEKQENCRFYYYHIFDRAEAMKPVFRASE
jgi:hypothetical protein